VSIVGVIWRNLLRRSRTRAPADLVPRPVGFRGLIEHETSLCTGCRTCAFVCSPQAISIEPREAGVSWRFFAGQCSFCGLCVAYCPTHAITNQGKLPPVTGDQSQHRVEHIVPYQTCTGCGASVIPLPESTLEALYDHTVSNTTRKEQGLCTTCRRKEASRRMAGLLLESR
jgi:hydrogenase-4 component H